MAKILRTYNPLSDGEITLGRPPEYPWDVWLDGRIWSIEEGTDFTCTVSSMVKLIRVAAAARGLGISVFRKNATTLIIKPRK